jgi:hypothetical protein
MEQRTRPPGFVATSGARTYTGTEGPGDAPGATTAEERPGPPRPLAAHSPSKAPHKKPTSRNAGRQDVLSARLNLLVDKLIEVDRRNRPDFALQVGELVVRELFEGDAGSLHRPGPKPRAFARLVLHPRLPFSPSTLSRAVGLFELLERLPDLKASCHRFEPGHLYAVLVAPRETQKSLLSECLQQDWSVARLRAEVARVRKGEEGTRRGRRPLPPGLRALGTVARVLQTDPPLRDLQFIEHLDPEQARQVKQLLEELYAWCRQAVPLVEQKLGANSSP